ncbi:uncharacterized protein Z519_02578 [Cladophialophora bantiana CBS 173.52]|uniref:Uncharacterized protein n=1 Tax=Cladophialophora bantiana (strain ATCC 10958 / CBS 173.52 / CDC B-1940 / NIH 8579) TaxID=1442370 RepID=A0A0D2F4N0_CLAB1|nr:uncharacterized protein Z519_02578 [Cladophialophora bantiana CBS 173.52]KIW97186.1 hypothetical protein Z519_02578 [Cladophialophora bantiana CBS 173.52]
MNRQQCNLSNLIHLVRCTRCEDPRDKIYALLSLEDQAVREAHPILPNYKLLVWDLFIDVYVTRLYEDIATDRTFVKGLLAALELRKPGCGGYLQRNGRGGRYGFGMVACVFFEALKLKGLRVRNCRWLLPAIQVFYNEDLLGTRESEATKAAESFICDYNRHMSFFTTDWRWLPTRLRCQAVDCDWWRHDDNPTTHLRITSRSRG